MLTLVIDPDCALQGKCTLVMRLFPPCLLMVVYLPLLGYDVHAIWLRRYDFHKFIFGGLTSPQHRLRLHSPEDFDLFRLPALLALHLWTVIAASFYCCFVEEFIFDPGNKMTFPILTMLLFLGDVWIGVTYLKLTFDAAWGDAVPKLGRHSPKDIAILRCAENIFYIWDEENDQKKLDQKFANSDVTHVVVIRRVCDDQVDDLNVEPLPLLHVEIAHNPYKDISDDSTEVTNLMQWISFDGIWTDSTVGGASFAIHIYPASKLNEKGNLVDHGTDSGALVCGWKVYSGSFAKLEKRFHMCKIWPEEADALLNSRVPSLKNCASFAVLHQHRNKAEKKIGVLPRCVLANMKGQWYVKQRYTRQEQKKRG